MTMRTRRLYFALCFVALTAVAFAAATLSGDLDLNGHNIVNGVTTVLPAGSIPWTNTNDGAASGLDADSLDGVQGAGYARTHMAGAYAPPMNPLAVGSFTDTESASPATSTGLAMRHPAAVGEYNPLITLYSRTSRADTYGLVVYDLSTYALGYGAIYAESSKQNALHGRATGTAASAVGCYGYAAASTGSGVPARFESNDGGTLRGVQISHTGDLVLRGTQKLIGGADSSYANGKSLLYYSAPNRAALMEAPSYQVSTDNDTAPVMMFTGVGYGCYIGDAFPDGSCTGFFATGGDEKLAVLNYEEMTYAYGNGALNVQAGDTPFIDTTVPILARNFTGTVLNPGSEEAVTYIKNGKFIIKYNESGTYRWKYMTLSGTSTTWTYSATEP